MNNILLENKVKVLERLVLQDIVKCYSQQRYSEKSYDDLMAKLLDRLTGFYEKLELDAVSLQRLSQYGDRAKIYTEQLREELDKAAAVTVRQIVKQLPREKLSVATQWEVIQAVRPVLRRRMEVLGSLLSASSLQMKNYMLLWDYQDAGFTHYCLLTEGENCDDCNSLEGQIFPISEARMGENFAPMHPNCNCRVGILDDENRIITIIYKGEEHETHPDDKNWLDSVSNLLTAASLIPGLDTFTNLASIPVDLARGDFLSAGLSAIGMIPVVGEVGDTAKLAKMADKAVDAAKVADKTTDFTKFTKKLHLGRQGKHIVDHNNYKKGRSIFSGTVSDAQQLINEYSGTGQKINATSERVDFKKVIGQYVDEITGKAYDTTVGTIRYSKDGAHIVPARPINWRK